MLWSSLPPNHPDKLSCLNRNFTYKRRPVDDRSRSGDVKDLFHANLFEFLDPISDVNCIVIIGYFQNKDPCFDHVYKMWPSLVNTPTRPFIPRFQFNSDDMVIHFRCAPGHYGNPSKILFYILLLFSLHYCCYSSLVTKQMLIIFKLF